MYVRGAYRRLVKGYRPVAATPERSEYVVPAWAADNEYEAHLMEQYDKQFTSNSSGSADCESSAVYFAY